MEHHHHDAGTEATGLAAWMVGMLVFVAGVVLLITLLLWSPWSDGGSDPRPVDQPAPEEQAPSGEQGGSDTDVDIEGDINVDEGQ